MKIGAILWIEGRKRLAAKRNNVNYVRMHFSRETHLVAVLAFSSSRFFCACVGKRNASNIDAPSVHGRLSVVSFHECKAHGSPLNGILFEDFRLDTVTRDYIIIAPVSRMFITVRNISIIPFNCESSCYLAIILRTKDPFNNLTIRDRFTNDWERTLKGRNGGRYVCWKCASRSPLAFELCLKLALNFISQWSFKWKECFQLIWTNF